MNLAVPSTPYSLKLFENENRLEDDSSEAAQLRQKARIALKHLWQNWHENASPSLFSLDFIKQLWQKQDDVTALYNAIFVERDPFFLRIARECVQEALHSLCRQLQESPPDTQDNINKVLFALNNILAIYAMLCPTPEETITLPQYIDNEWVSVEYQITPIELTPQTGLWLNILKEEDRLFSYGLTPKDNTNAHPLLLHCGTGWPTAQGHIIQILADIWPNKTPGEIFFEWRHEHIEKWLETTHLACQKKIITTGQSLGGSLAYLTALAFPNHIKKAYALNPPGMPYNYPDTHPYFGAWEKTPFKERPDVYIQKQDDDFVSKCGVFKDDFHLIKLKVKEKNGLTPHSLSSIFTAHARSYAHCDDCELTEANMRDENNAKRRLQNNKWLFSFGRVVFFYTILTPYFFLFRATKNHIKHHAFELLIFSLAMVLFSLFPPFGALLSLPFIPSLGSVLLSSILPSIAISQIITGIINYGHDFLFDKKEKWLAYVAELKALDPTIRKGKLLFDITNVMTLGLLKVTVRGLLRICIDPLHHALYGRKETCDIHTPQYQAKTNDLNRHKPPSFMTKLQLASLVVLFYVVVVPIKFVVYDIPTFFIKKISHKHKTQAATATDTPPSDEKAPAPTPPRKQTTHFGSFFSCCRQSNEEAFTPSLESQTPVRKL
jgi:pimeloyl-ACP methyl ester carboxylesterase